MTLKKMSVHGIDWHDLKLFLSDHPSVSITLEQDKSGLKYLVLTSKKQQVPVEEEEVEKKAVLEEKVEEKAVLEEEKDEEVEKKEEVEEKETSEEEETSDEEEKETSDAEEEDEASDDSDAYQDEEEEAVFKMEVRDKIHEDAVEATRTIMISSFIGALTSTLLSYCAC